MVFNLQSSFKDITSSDPTDTGIINISILQMRKLRLGEVKELFCKMLLLRISRVGTGIRLVCLLKSLLQGLTCFLSAVRALWVVY